MVRMAQEFSLKYPLVDGQGNFGNIDGDNAAAMRYTEAKLTEFAELLIKDIDSNTVDFKETYDGEDMSQLYSICNTKFISKWFTWYRCRYGNFNSTS